jgi:transcriptional regulator with XRE-family HTH domain
MNQTDLRATARPSRLTGMNFRHALGEVIREQRLAKGLTLRTVSANGYVSLGHLSDVERGQKEASSDCVEAIANGLGVNAYDLIIEAGYRMAGVPDTPESLFPSPVFADSRL